MDEVSAQYRFKYRSRKSLRVYKSWPWARAIPRLFFFTPKPCLGKIIQGLKPRGLICVAVEHPLNHQVPVTVCFVASQCSSPPKGVLKTQFPAMAGRPEKGLETQGGCQNRSGLDTDHHTSRLFRTEGGAAPNITSTSGTNHTTSGMTQHALRLRT